MSVAILVQNVLLFRQTESLNMSDGQAYPVRFAQHSWIVFKPQAAWGNQHLWVLERVREFFKSSETSESHLTSRTQKQWQATHKLMWPGFPPTEIVVGPKRHSAKEEGMLVMLLPWVLLWRDVVCPHHC